MNPMPKWKYQKSINDSIFREDTVDIPVKPNIPGNVRVLDFINDRSDYVIYSRDDYAEGFTLFVKTGVGTDINTVHLYDVRDLAAPLWRYPAYLLIPFTVVYDAITIPLWIKDTIFYHDT